eukprot:TRINITY_DN67969_c3_g2_i1.p1 TRINITY_DN67969_c3_g2~~TRINITY_DN67969_c3_g2_i1.p1  ORF type:complete len:219 (-),score=11.74 TRINITY_DN67969_c3_g2_i1:87-713(-)
MRLFLLFCLLMSASTLDIDFCGCHVIYIQDVSGSWFPSEFSTAKELAANIFSTVNLQNSFRNNTHNKLTAGLISYANKVRVEQNMTTDFYKQLTALENMKLTHGTTRTHLALQAAKEMVEQTSTKCTAVVIVTDGDSNFPSEAAAAAAALKATDCYVYAFGVGPLVDVDAIRTLASPGLYRIVRDVKDLAPYSELLLPPCSCVPTEGA